MKPDTLEVGRFIRRPIRRLLLSLGIDFKEDKGLVVTTFYFHATPTQYAELEKFIKNYYGEDD